jgi:signal transduction protein with GAF and PtsI domain
VTPIDSPQDVDIVQRRLLQSIAEMARIVFGAAAASVFLVDHQSGDLVFEAVAGEGEGHLPGSRFPSGTGIAGWAAMYGQPLLVDDVVESPQFARDAAESTGYVPRSIMAAPLIAGGDCVGVLEVLDHDIRPRCELGDIDSLGQLSTQLATVLELLTRIRWTGDGQPAGAFLDVPLLQRVAERLPVAPEPLSATVTKLLAMADELLAGGDTVGGTLSA